MKFILYIYNSIRSYLLSFITAGPLRYDFHDLLTFTNPAALRTRIVKFLHCQISIQYNADFNVQLFALNTPYFVISDILSQSFSFSTLFSSFFYSP